MVKRSRITGTTKKGEVTFLKKSKKRSRALIQTAKKRPKKVKKKPLEGLKKIVPPQPIPIKPELGFGGKIIIKHPTVSDIVDPKECYAVDINGKFKRKEKPSAKLDIPMFWQSQRKKIAILMFFSALFLFMSFITLADSYINFIYDSIVGGIWAAIWLVVSLLMGWVG